MKKRGDDEQRRQSVFVLFTEDGSGIAGSEGKSLSQRFQTIAVSRSNIRRVPTSAIASALTGKPLPLQYVTSNIEKRVQEMRLYSDMLLYWPFLIMFIFFFLSGRDIETNHMASSAVVKQLQYNAFPSMERQTEQALAVDRSQIPSLDTGRKWGDIARADHFLTWFEDVFIPQTWDCQNPGYSRATLFKRGQLEYIGALKLRVLAMRNTSCTINNHYTSRDVSAPQDCYSEHKRSGENRRSVCNLPNPANPSEMLWQYTSDEDAVGSARTTGVTGFYHKGGYVANVPFNATCTMVRELAALLRRTDDCGIINDFSTRFVIVEWFQYAGNTDTYLLAKMFAEVSSSGSWVTSYQIRMFPVWTAKRLGMSIYDIFFFIFVLYFVYRLFYDWILYYREKKKLLSFFFNVWNLLEMANLCTFTAVMILRWIWWSQSRSSKIDFPFETSYPADLDYVALLFFMQIYANSVNVVITVLKVLKYLRLNNRMNILTRTFAVCQDSIIGVLVLFVFIVLGYAICGTALYGSNLQGYRNVSSSFSSLMFMLLGQFQYTEMRQLQPALTVFYFFTYEVLSFFLLLNMIIAILSEGFSQVSDETSLEPLDQVILRQIGLLRLYLHPRNLKKIIELRLQNKSRDQLLGEMSKYLREHLDMIEVLRPELLDNDLPMYRDDLKNWLPEHILNDLGDYYLDMLWDDIDHDYHIDIASKDTKEQKSIESTVAEAAGEKLALPIASVDKLGEVMTSVEQHVDELAKYITAPL